MLGPGSYTTTLLVPVSDREETNVLGAVFRSSSLDRTLNRYLLTLRYKETLLRTIHSGTFSSSDSYIHLLTTTLFQSVLQVSAFQPTGDKFSKLPYDR